MIKLKVANQKSTKSFRYVVVVLSDHNGIGFLDLSEDSVFTTDKHIPIIIDPNYERTGYIAEPNIIGNLLEVQRSYECIYPIPLFEAFLCINIFEDSIENKIKSQLQRDKHVNILLYKKIVNNLVGDEKEEFVCGVLVDEHLCPFKWEDFELEDPIIRKRKEIRSNKRLDYISWDEYFMGIAKLSSLRSKDPKTQVGCCIVKDNKILSIGYNGMPNNCSDDKFPWNREDADPLNIKYLYVVHAELNAILNYKGESLEGSTIYVTLFPCNECAKAIIQSGIKNIVYLEERDSIETQASKRMLQSAGVNYTKYKPTNKTLNIDV